MIKRSICATKSIKKSSVIGFDSDWTDSMYHTRNAANAQLWCGHQW